MANRARNEDDASAVGILGSQRGEVKIAFKRDLEMEGRTQSKTTTGLHSNDGKEAVMYYRK